MGALVGRSPVQLLTTTFHLFLPLQLSACRHELGHRLIHLWPSDRRRSMPCGMLEPDDHGFHVRDRGQSCQRDSEISDAHTPSAFMTDRSEQLGHTWDQ